MNTSDFGFVTSIIKDPADKASGNEAGINMSEADAVRFRAMFEQAPSFIAIVQMPEHVFKVANEAYYKLVGHRELIGLSIRDAMPEMVQQGFLTLLNRVYLSGKSFVGRQVPVKFQHEPHAALLDRYVDFIYQPLFDGNKNVFGIFIQGNDVTDQKLAEDSLRISNERWMFAIEGARDGVWDWDVPHGTLFVSDRYKEITGYTGENPLSTYEAWVDQINPDDLPKVEAAMQCTLSGGAPFHVEYRHQREHGQYLWVLARGVVVVRDQKGKPTRLTGTLSDISEKKLAEQTIWNYASFDQLTGLPNRRLFHERLELAVRPTDNKIVQFALLFIDLDHFKEVNDLRGHAKGDRLLAEVAHRLVGCINKGDTVARLGGDEFMVLLGNVEQHLAITQTAERLVSCLAAPFYLDTDVIHLTASIGVTKYPEDGSEADVLVRNADQAMYEAKNAGPGQFRFFTTEMKDISERRVELTHDLRQALAKGQLQVHYQPIVALESGEISKAEALLRWTHPKYGFVSPAVFIPLAEESGMIHEIGDWVLAEAAACAQAWSAGRATPFQVSVNFSPAQVLERNLEGEHALLRGRVVLPGTIAIEITEGMLLKASDRVVRLFARYRSAGVQISLDDFGTGYSALSYLTQFEFDFLKIDQSFVRTIHTAGRSLAIVESIIVMAHRLGLKVVAEGIELPEQAVLLQAAGCDFGQGYLYSKAIPSRQFETLLAHLDEEPVIPD